MPDQSQVKEKFDPISPSDNRTFPVESEYGTTQVLFISLDSNELVGNHPIPSR